MVVPDNWEPTSSGQATRTARSSVPASGMRTAHRETHHQQVTAVAGQGGVNLCKTLHTTAKAHLPAADLGVDRTGRAAARVSGAQGGGARRNPRRRTASTKGSRETRRWLVGCGERGPPAWLPEEEALDLCEREAEGL